MTWLTGSGRASWCSPNPTTTGGGYIFLADQIFRFSSDEAKAMDYMKRLDANVAQYPQKSPDAINWSRRASSWRRSTGARHPGQKEKNFPLKIFDPPDTAFEIGGVTIVKGSGNPEAAKVFLDWALNGGRRDQRETRNRISVRIGCHPA